MSCKKNSEYKIMKIISKILERDEVSTEGYEWK